MRDRSEENRPQCWSATIRVICSSSDSLPEREDKGMADAAGVFCFCDLEQRGSTCRSCLSYRDLAHTRNEFERLSHPFSAKNTSSE